MQAFGRDQIGVKVLGSADIWNPIPNAINLSVVL